MSISDNKNLRRAFYVVVTLLVIFYFRHSLLSIFSDTEVGGRKYIGLLVDGSKTNGFEYLEFNNLYFQIEKDNAKNWEKCSRLNKSLEGYFRELIKVQNTSTHYKYVSDVEPSGYKAYISFNNRIIFVRGFPDFGGAPPSEEEKKICE